MHMWAAGREGAEGDRASKGRNASSPDTQWQGGLTLRRGRDKEQNT